MSIFFTIPGVPVGKGRPKFARRGNFVSTYTPEKTASYENLVKVKALEAMQGQQIETAPKDGTEIIVMYVHIDTQIVHNAFWIEDDENADENGWWLYDHSEVSRVKPEDYLAPTHWMPLPEAPKGE